MKKVSGFLAATPLGTWLKVFISAILTQFMIGIGNGHDLFTWDLEMAKSFLTAGFIAVIPVVINYLNPKDERYGPTQQK
jgi:hypothetical protein